MHYFMSQIVTEILFTLTFIQLEASVFQTLSLGG